MLDLAGPIFAKIAETLLTVIPSAIGFAIAFAVLSLFSGQAWAAPGGAIPGSPPTSVIS
jgi:hypothetical protein